MSSDNPDKTVFRQPINKGDGTVVRPMPGGRASSSHIPLSDSPAAAGQQNPSYMQQPPSSQPHNRNINFNVSQFQTTFGLNPLVNASAMLIAVFTKTRETVSHANVGELHQQLVNELKLFETRSKEAGIRPEIVLAARYLLCTILDEAVLNTPWGMESAWTQRTLLSVFHNETEGGEKFFVILEKMRNTPAENIDILELMYILLSLGYEGKYRVVHRGRDLLEQLRDDLFQIIRRHRGEYERTLSPSWQGLGRIRNTLIQYVPMWVVASVIGGIMLLSYSGLRYWMHESTDDVAKQLTIISTTDLTKKKINLQ